jgi:hypothetical protein
VRFDIDEVVRDEPREEFPGDDEQNHHREGHYFERDLRDQLAFQS